jgi:hypothetical protein
MSETETMSRTNKYVGKEMKTRKRRRVADYDFKILVPGEQELLHSRNYRVAQLKEMCRHYKQRMSGNKDELTKRLYEYLFLSKAAVTIQKIAGNYLLRSYLKAKGPAFIKRSICVNDSDFFTMESVNEIPHSQFISYTDIDKMVYGFDMLSLYNMISKSSKPYRNPYNRNELPEELVRNCKKITKLSRFFGETNVVIQEEEVIDETKLLELRTLSLFQEINNLGNYADYNWLWSLSRVHLVRYIREIYDIWVYRANLSNEIKRQICPPTGNPFHGVAIHSLPTLDRNRLRQASLTVIQSIVMRSGDTQSRALGANYVLSALTLVNENAAISLPWLFQAVSYN